MASMGFNPSMPMGGGALQSSPFTYSGGAYNGQGMPLHASAHMAPPQAYAAQVRAGNTSVCDSSSP